MNDSNFKFRVAFATNNGKSVDGHFGNCMGFAIYEFDEDSIDFIGMRPLKDLSCIEKNDIRANQIKDCHLLYVASIGGPAAAKVIKLGIHPLRDNHNNQITDVLDRLQTVINNNPTPWMAKMMGRTSPLAEQLLAVGE